MKAILFSLFAVLCLVAAPAGATDQELHQAVEHSLVQLRTTGTARMGPKTGTEVTSKGTGFFVGSDGYILTTAHVFDPLKEVNAANASIEAKFEGTGTDFAKAVYVSELASLDLVLLRAIADNNIKVPPSLEIGHSNDVDRNDPKLLTSGYDVTGYRAPPISFNSTSNADAAFSWTLNGKTNFGASGSPVYMDHGGEPLVVGVLSATAKDDDELSLMIPIEYSFQLIGQFKMKELQDEVAALKRRLGETADGNPTLTTRVDDIEKSVDEIKENFSWTAKTEDATGALIVKYRKLVSGGPQVDQISVSVQPYPYVLVPDENNKLIRKAVASLTWKKKTLDRSSPELEERSGTFVMADLKDKLTKLIQDSDATAKDDPFRDIVVTIFANVADANLQTELSIVPQFTWNFVSQ